MLDAGSSHATILQACYDAINILPPGSFSRYRETQYKHADWANRLADLCVAYLEGSEWTVSSSKLSQASERLFQYADILAQDPCDSVDAPLLPTSTFQIISAKDRGVNHYAASTELIGCIDDLEARLGEIGSGVVHFSALRASDKEEVRRLSIFFVSRIRPGCQP